MKTVSGLAYEETSLLFPNLPNPVILDVALTQPHHLDAIISEPRVMFDGQQQLRGELLLLAGKVRLARATLPCSILLFLLLFFSLFVFFLFFNVSHNHFVQKMGHRLE